MPTLPLLHAADATLTRFTTVDVRLIAIAILALAAANLLIWAPTWPERALRRLGRRHVRHRLLRATALLLFGLAILPAVLPVDHMLPDVTHAADEAHAEGVHAAHCHESPANCADAPVTSGPGQMLDGGLLIPQPALSLAVVLLAAAPILHSVARRPDLRPPQALLSA
jgi:hypothetical protein